MLTPSDASDGPLQGPTGAAPLERIGTLVLLASAIALDIVAFIYIWNVLGLDAPVEYRENAILFTTDLLLAGENPYDIVHQPVFINVYGLAYHWVVLPFAAVWGAGFATHRAVSAFFSVLCAAALGFGLIRTSVRWPLAVASASLWLIQLVRGLSLSARPDSLGTFLFFASVLVPSLRRFTRSSLAASALLGILALLAKPYFVLGIPLVGAYVFCFRSKRTAILYFGGSMLALGATLWTMHLFFPYYLTDCFLVHWNVASSDFFHMAGWAYDYALRNWGPLLIAVTGGLWTTLSHRPDRVRRAGGWHARWQRLRSLDAPLMASSASLMSFALLSNVILVVAWLGPHRGNEVLYYDQLISPFLYWVAAVYASTIPKLRAPFLLFVTLALLGWPPAYATRLPVNQAEWRDVEALISRYPRVYVSAPLAHLARRQGKPVYDTGQSEYFRDGGWRSTDARSGAYGRRGEEIAKEIDTLAARKHFDLMILSNKVRPFISDQTFSGNYVWTGSKRLTIGDQEFEFRIFRPK
jgi:hypothetical protein